MHPLDPIPSKPAESSGPAPDESPAIESFPEVVEPLFVPPISATQFSLRLFFGVMAMAALFFAGGPMACVAVLPLLPMLLLIAVLKWIDGHRYQACLLAGVAVLMVTVVVTAAFRLGIVWIWR